MQGQESNFGNSSSTLAPHHKTYDHTLLGIEFSTWYYIIIGATVLASCILVITVVICSRKNSSDEQKERIKAKIDAMDPQQLHDVLSDIEEKVDTGLRRSGVTLNEVDGKYSKAVYLLDDELPNEGTSLTH